VLAISGIYDLKGMMGDEGPSGDDIADDPTAAAELPVNGSFTGRFRPGIGMIASRLDVPVVPVRLEGVDRVLHHTWHMARPGRVRVAFGAPMRLTGEDYEALAKQVEDAVRALLP
jgi:1-acyl-sn-glycerol-3-phosphate acyltransferase